MASASSTFAPAPAASRWRLPPRRPARRSSRPTAIARACRSWRRAPSGRAPTIETRLLNPPQRARRARRLARTGRPRAGRRALLGQRHLAAQSRRALAADARAARPARRRCSSGCSTLPPSWSGRAGGWSMPSARCCPAKGQGRLTASSSAVHRGLVRKRPLPAGVRTVAGRLLTPGHDRTDGFFVARLRPTMLGRGDRVESLMRSLPRLLLIGFAGLALAAPVAGQRADDQILPKSVELQHQAQGADRRRQARSRPRTCSKPRLPSIRATAGPSSTSPASPRSSICSARRSG